MKCYVGSCTNTEKNKSSGSHKISFHVFPKDPKQRVAWMAAIGVTDWWPHDRIVICSDHFKDNDFFFTKNGIRRLKSSAVPQIDDSSPAVMRICKICLTLDTKLFYMKKLKLCKMYKDVVGVSAIDENLLGNLPIQLCWECVARLKTAAAFKAKALFADTLMRDILEITPFIKIKDIMTIHEKHKSFKSSLITENLLTLDNINMGDREKSPLKTEEIDIPHNYEMDVPHQLEMEIDLPPNNEKDLPHNDEIDSPHNNIIDSPHNNKIDIKNNEEIETDIKNLLLPEVRIKDEANNVMLIHEYDQFCKDAVKTEVDLVSTRFEGSVDDRNNDSLGDYDDFGNDHDNTSVIFEEKKVSTGVDSDEAVVEVFTNVKGKSYVQKNEDGDVIGIGEVFSKNEENIESGEFSGDAGNDSVLFTQVTKTKMPRIKKIEVVKRKKKKNSFYNYNMTSRVEKHPYERPKMPIDESIMTIRNLTHDDMVQEVMRRKNSMRYLDATFKCDICYRWFPTSDKLSRHSLKHRESNGPYECEICKTRVKHMSALRAHMNRQHTTEYSCKQCPFITKSRCVAIAHLRFHAGSKFKCPQCAVVFDIKTTLLNHLRLKHMSDSVCELCGYTFVSKTGVGRHKVLKHPLVKKDIKLEGPHCDVCDVKFLSQKAYDRHLRLSSKHIKSEDDPKRMSNDPSIQSRLGTLFRPKAVRRPVIRTRDPNQKLWKANEPVDCEQCGVNLPNLHAYACHFKTTHPGINRTKFPYMKTPYMCEQCGKMFLNTTLLNSHQWVHTGEKCFQCDHCNKSFSQKANLANHIMNLHDTSASRRVFDCRVCGKVFTSSSNKNRHMFLHTGLKPFKCDACEKSFPTLGELRAHVDYVHLKKPRPKRVRRKARKYDGPQLEY